MLLLIKKCVKSSVPLMIVYLLVNTGNFLSMLIIASLGSTALAASAIISTTLGTGMMIVMSFVLPISIGSGFLLGNSNYQGIGHFVNQGIIIATLLGLFLVGLMIASVPILSFSIRSQPVVVLTSHYFHACALGIIPSCWLLALGQFFIGIQYIRAYLFFSLFNISLTLILTYLLIKEIFPSKFGIQGAGLAFSISNIVTLFFELVYIILIKAHQTFHLFKFNQQYSWKPMLNMGVTIAIQRVNEFIALMILTYLIGYLLTEQALAAQQVMLQIIMLTSLIPFGISQAIGPLVSQYLGKGEVANALKIGWVANGVGLILAIIVSVIFLLKYKVIVSWFVFQSQYSFNIVDLFSSLFVIVAIYIVVDTLRIITMGILRSFNEIKSVMAASVTSFWLIAFPVIYITYRLHPSSLFAIDLGFLLGVISNCILNLGLLYQIEFKTKNTFETTNFKY